MMAVNQSQAVVLTGPGATAIAVVRIEGALVEGFLAEHFRGRPKLRRCVHGVLVDGEKVLDDPVVAMMGAQRADINLHGGPWVVASVVQLLERCGFVIRGALGAGDEADDDVRGQVESSWMDGSTGIERQMIASLSSAPTELAIKLLLAQPRMWGQLAAEVMEQNRAQRQERLEGVIEDGALYNLMRRPRVAIVGAPNVGKSTLANRLFGEERSITADLPGTTRDWVGEVANIDGLAVMLVDTPGIRQTEDPIEREAIEKSSPQIRTAELVVLVLDAQRVGDAASQRMREQFPKALRVMNKVDLVKNAAIEGMSQALAISAMRDEGVDAVRQAILQHFGCARLEPERARWWREDQGALLREAIDEPSLLSELVQRMDE